MRKKFSFNGLMVFLLVLIWISHLIQVFVPETGFDALWYHLPVIDQIARHHGLVFLPDLYQSVNPLFSDLIFLVGYVSFGMLGTKLIAYMFGLGLVLVSYKLLRLFVDEKFALVGVIFISTFQVVAWQSASFYVDVANAFWQLSALYFLLSKENKTGLVLSALMLGVALATKLFSLLLLPLFVLFVYWRGKNIREKVFNMFIFLFFCLVVVWPFYYFAFINTGNPLYSFVVHFNKLNQIGGDVSLFSYIISRVVTLPWSLIKVSLIRDYVSPFFSILIIYILYNKVGRLINKVLRRTLRRSGFNSKAWQDILSTRFESFKSLFINRTNDKKKALFLYLFSIYNFLLWWFIPPLSTRYALSAFVGFVVLFLNLAKKDENIKNKSIVIYFLVIISLINMMPRLYVNFRSMKYIVGLQTQQQYLDQFRDGWIDVHLDNWYSN